MSILKYLLLGLMCLSITNLIADDYFVKTDSVCSGYFVDESFPNPFSPVIALVFGIPDSALVTVEVHKVDKKERINKDIETERIKILLQEKLSKGMYQIFWDGTDSEGNKQRKNDFFIYCIKIERRTPTLYGDGYIRMEAKTKITFPL